MSEKLKDYSQDDHNANKGSARGQKQIVGSVQRNGFGRSMVADRNRVLFWLVSYFISTSLRTANLPFSGWTKSTETYRAYLFSCLTRSRSVTFSGAILSFLGVRRKYFTAKLARFVFNTPQRFVVASIRAEGSMGITPEIFPALFASLGPILVCVLTTFFAGALRGAANLFHLVGPKLVIANWASLEGENREAVNLGVAVGAKGFSVTDIESEFGIFLPTSDMMRLQDAPHLTALLTGPFVPSQNSLSPFSVFSPPPNYVALSGSFAFPPLVVGQFISFLHCLAIHLLPAFCIQKHLAGLRDFICSLWRLVGASFRAVLTGIAFVLDLKLGLAELTSSNHFTHQIKTPLAAGCPFVTTQADNRAGVRNDDTIAVRIEQLFCLCGRGIIA